MYTSKSFWVHHVSGLVVLLFLRDADVKSTKIREEEEYSIPHRFITFAVYFNRTFTHRQL